MTLADKIITLRTKHGLSQEELAEKLDVSRQTIGKWETGQAIPELPGLIALSSYFAISIDTLVKDSSCDLLPPDPIASDDLSAFLMRAKRATYAGFGQEVPPQRPGAHEFFHTEGPFCYRDSYWGGRIFHGQEIVRRNNQAIWSMNYSGRTLSDYFSGDFLKEALRRGTQEMPYRGPHLYRNDDYTYVCDAEGNLDWFSGNEVIYYHDILVYECRFHGGCVH